MHAAGPTRAQAIREAHERGSAPHAGEGRPGRDAAAAAERLRDLIAALTAHGDDTRRRLDRLSALLDELECRLPAAAAPASTACAAPERVAAIEMAVCGYTRAEAAERLRRDHGLPDPAAVLDDVFGPVTSSDGSHGR